MSRLQILWMERSRQHNRPDDNQGGDTDHPQ